MTAESRFVIRRGADGDYEYLAWSDPDEPLYWTSDLFAFANQEVDGDVLVLTDIELARQTCALHGGEIVEL